MELVIAFIFGLIYGSFLNVVILRFDDWVSIINSRSRCPECRTNLAWYDLIPVISYATLMGKCRYCQKPISWQYPAVELLSAILVAGSYCLVFGSGLPLVREIVAFSLLILAIGAIIVILCHDLYEMLIPDAASYFLLAASFLFGWVWSGNILMTLLGGLIGLAPIALLVYPSRGKWMGEGDVKLALALGLLVGYPNAIVFLVSAFMMGGIIGLLIVLAGRAGLKSAVPFAPFLIAGALLALFYGSSLLHWYLGMLTGGY